MSKITKIEVQKKDKERVNIYIDEEFYIAVFAEIIYSLNIKKGDVIDKDTLDEMLKNEMFMKCKNKALSILSRTGQSEKKIREKLHSDFDEITIDDTIIFLKNYNFINDDELAERIVNTNINLNKYGKNKIKQNLYNKGINSSIINEAISSLDSDKEFENALHLAKKRYERVKNEDRRKIYQKISQHLAYKGFEYDIIKKVLNQLLSYDEYDL